MKKVLYISVIGILLISSIGAVATTKEMKSDYNLMEKSSIFTLEFPPMTISKYDKDFIEISLQDTSSFFMEPGKPVVPKVIETIELPFGIRNVKVEVTPYNIQEFPIENEIRPAPPHVLLTEVENNVMIKSEKNEDIYTSEKLFPYSWYSYRVGCGLNNHKERVTHISIHIFPIRYSPTLSKISVAERADIKITYDLPEINPFPENTEYDMVIIAPSKFKILLQKLVNHKNSFGVDTVLKTTEEIYDEFDGVDKPEQIKYFIKEAIETWGINYVLLVGGLKSKVWANPRDHSNYGAKSWYVPVRYHNFIDNPEHPLSMEKIFDPGVISDLYYADVYREGGEFEDWDPNGDGMMAAWNKEGYENDTGIDFYPDVILSRLACRNIFEVITLVNKIIKYEQTPADDSWFKKAIMISGDGFMDQEDLDFQWDTNGLPDGKYTIYAQSKNPDDVYGLVEEINITIDSSAPTSLTFNHDDHLRITGYPTGPIAEIVSVSEEDVLGNTDFDYEPTEGEAYGNGYYGWANVNFTDGILHIRGKTYDPQPYGNLTDIHVWIENEDNDIVFDDWRYNSEMYYEGEWITGEKTLKGGGGAMYYMPEDFEREIIWASNGKLIGPDDIINALNPGCGFAFLSGHGSPNVWTDHFPGIPGNRRYGSIPSLAVIRLQLKLPFIKFPLKELTNQDKPPIILIGGCHNSQFNVSMIPCLLDVNNKKNTWCHGNPVPECFSWFLVRLSGRGAIATIGNTGLGYGTLGKDCLIEGLDGGICIEFFKQYGILYNDMGYGILGDAYTNTLTEYINKYDIEFLDHAKSLTQWVLFGDPSLMIGGYT